MAIVSSIRRIRYAAWQRDSAIMPQHVTVVESATAKDATNCWLPKIVGREFYTPLITSVQKLHSLFILFIAFWRD